MQEGRHRWYRRCNKSSTWKIRGQVRKNRGQLQCWIRTVVDAQLSLDPNNYHFEISTDPGIPGLSPTQRASERKETFVFRRCQVSWKRPSAHVVISIIWKCDRELRWKQQPEGAGDPLHEEHWGDTVWRDAQASDVILGQPLNVDPFLTRRHLRIRGTSGPKNCWCGRIA